MPIFFGMEDLERQLVVVKALWGTGFARGRMLTVNKFTHEQ